MTDTNTNKESINEIRKNREREKFINEKWETLKKLWKYCDSYEEFSLKADVSGIDEWNLRFWFWYFELTVNHPVLFNRTDPPLLVVLFLFNFLFSIFAVAIYEASQSKFPLIFLYCSIFLFLISLLISLPQISQKYRELDSDFEET
jgi:hypothetical protein